jgi:hypothetical protein
VTSTCRYRLHYRSFRYPDCLVLKGEENTQGRVDTISPQDNLDLYVWLVNTGKSLRHGTWHQKEHKTRQYSLHAIINQKQDPYSYLPVSTTHVQGFYSTECLRMAYKCRRWGIWGRGEVTVVRDLCKHIDLRHVHCKQPCLQRIMSNLLEKLQHKSM